MTALVSDEARAVFVHVQKTGGQTLSHLLVGALPDARQPIRESLKHPPLQQILSRHPEVRGYWIFGFVRNPWARLLSWHSRIMARTEEEQARHRLWGIVHAEYPSFEDFVLGGLDDDRLAQLSRPQASFLRTTTRVADFVGRQETFDADVRAIFARLSLPLPGDLPEVNASGSKARDYRDAYSSAAREKVATVFERDVAAFGYEF